jgi:predicted small lipoprotein YifL
MSRPMPWRALAAVALLLLLAAPLAACGKKGLPEPPPGEPNTYPRTYPAQ